MLLNCCKEKGKIVKLLGPIDSLIDTENLGIKYNDMGEGGRSAL